MDLLAKLRNFFIGAGLLIAAVFLAFFKGRRDGAQEASQRAQERSDAEAQRRQNAGQEVAIEALEERRDVERAIEAGEDEDVRQRLKDEWATPDKPGQRL